MSKNLGWIIKTIALAVGGFIAIIGAIVALCIFLYDGWYHERETAWIIGGASFFVGMMGLVAGCALYVLGQLIEDVGVIRQCIESMSPADNSYTTVFNPQSTNTTHPLEKKNENKGPGTPPDWHRFL